MEKVGFLGQLVTAAFICGSVFAVVVILNSTQPEPIEAPVPIVSIEEIPPELFPAPVKPAVPDVDPDQLHCLAMNIYHEGRSESELGKTAIAHVTLNRVAIGKPRFRDTICGVVYQGRHWTTQDGERVPVRYKCHFSWYCDGKSDELKLTTPEGRVIQAEVDAWELSQKIAWEAIVGESTDPTNGADHYYNPDEVIKPPRWSQIYTQVAVVDKHHFHVSHVFQPGEG